MTYNLAIIGGGPAGYTAAEKAGINGLTTVLFEKNALGGVCLNEGCIPTKTLLYSAKLWQNFKDASKYGIHCQSVDFDLNKIILRKNKVIKKLNAGIAASLKKANVELVPGEAILSGKKQGCFEISCNDKIFSAERLMIATGSETIMPSIPGLNHSVTWTNKVALDNRELPGSLIIIGGGVVGLEFASFFNSLGTKVAVIEMMDEILPGMDKELSVLLREEYTKKGIHFLLGSKVIKMENGTVKVVKVSAETTEEEINLSFEKILLSVGRKPILKGFGLESLNLEINGNGLKVNDYMQTSHSNVYACGDVTGFSMLAHTAAREAEVAVDHLLGFPTTMSYRAIPSVVYTNPEFAGVGKTEEQLKTEGIPYHKNILPMAHSGRFVAENEAANGFCKILLGENDQILGVHLLGNPASELIVIAGMAIEKGMTGEELQNMVFPHPTVAEIIKVGSNRK